MLAVLGRLSRLCVLGRLDVLRVLCRSLNVRSRPWVLDSVDLNVLCGELVSTSRASLWEDDDVREPVCVWIIASGLTNSRVNWGHWLWLDGLLRLGLNCGLLDDRLGWRWVGWLGRRFGWLGRRWVCTWVLATRSSILRDLRFLVLASINLGLLELAAANLGLLGWLLVNLGLIDLAAANLWLLGWLLVNRHLRSFHRFRYLLS